MPRQLNFSARVAKIILLVCNLIVVLVGLGLMSFGIWFVCDPHSVTMLNVTSDETLRQLVQLAGAILVAVGLFMTFVGFAGCCGALNHNTCCLNCFSIFLIIFILLQIVATILAGVFHNQVMNKITQSMNTSVVKNYGVSNYTTEAWDFMQYELSCCAVKNYTDWKYSAWKSSSKSGNHEVPASCCHLKTADWVKPVAVDWAACDAEAKRGSGFKQLHNQGCEEKFEEWFRKYWSVLIAVVAVTIVTELVGIGLSSCLTSSMRRGYDNFDVTT